MVMDPSKLDKMKVVELRAELTARGLDTKGVKAVLVDRLKAAIEAGTGVAGNAEREPSVPPPGTPTATPGRRGRRTRSMTRSPSPVKKTDPVLETLDEEPQAADPQNEKEEPFEPQDEKCEEPSVVEPISQPEDQPPAEQKIVEEEPEEMKSPQKTPEKRAEIKRRSSDRRSEDKKADDKAKTDSNKTKTEGNKSKAPEASPEVKEKKSPEKRQRRRTSDGAEEPPAKIPAIENPPEEDEQNEAPDADAGKDSVDEDAEPAIEKMEVDASDKVEEDQHTVAKMETDEKPEEKEKRRSRSRSRSPSRSVSRSRSRSGSRSRSRTSRSRSRSRSESERKHGRKSPELNADDFTNEEDEPVIEDKQFGLSWFDSDLHLRIDPVTFNSAKPLTEDAFGLVWSGARTNFGVRDGKVVYEIRLSEELACNPFRDEKHLKGFRCGLSFPKTGLLLGEFENSFAYCESGQKVVNGEFTDYGKPFGLDDVIACYLDLESTPCKVEFTLNGESQGVAFEFDKEILGESDALFPHILTKGYEFQINFADNENLLVNVEKPKRQKKKTPSPSPQKKKDTRESDHWDSDHEKKDEDSSEKKENAEEEKKEEPVVEAEVPEVEKEDADIENQEKKDEGKENKEEPKETEIEKETEADAEAEPEAEVEAKAEAEKDKEIEEKMEETTESDDKDKSKSEEDIKEDVEEPREPIELLPGYELIGLLPEEALIQGPQRPESRKGCEVYMLVGLPGSGKTHWAMNQVKENPEKRYDVIGPDALIEKMKVNGKPRKECHGGKWDKVYDLCCKSVGVLEEIATKRRRNYILDQVGAV